MKQQVDQHRSEKCFDIGDWVFLLLHLKQAINEKEMLAILHALKKWIQPYLVIHWSKLLHLKLSR